jgi:hypothetical protein
MLPNGIFLHLHYTSNNKVTDPLKATLEEHWGRAKVRHFFSNEDILGLLPAADFDSIWWAGFHCAMASYTQMFHIFITNQASGWCGSNSKLSVWDNDGNNGCPNCGLVNETSKHMTHCRHEGCVTLLHESIIEVTNCL